MYIYLYIYIYLHISIYLVYMFIYHLHICNNLYIRIWLYINILKIQLINTLRYYIQQRFWPQCSDAARVKHDGGECLHMYIYANISTLYTHLHGPHIWRLESYSTQPSHLGNCWPWYFLQWRTRRYVYTYICIHVHLCICMNVFIKICI
jgi:hypothetical protein